MIEYTTVRFKFEDDKPTKTTKYEILILEKAIDHKYDEKYYLTYRSFNTLYDAITYLNTYREEFLPRELARLDLDSLSSIECVIEECDSDDNVIETSYEETLWAR